jgi:hypothetical protein
MVILNGKRNAENKPIGSRASFIFKSKSSRYSYNTVFRILHATFFEYRLPANTLAIIVIGTMGLCTFCSYFKER